MYEIMNVISFKLTTFSLMGLAIYAVYLFAHSSHW